MSDIRVKVNVTELVDDLNLNEKRKLVEYLKEEMAEAFDTPIPDGEYRPVDLEADTYVDMDDIIWEMSSWDKQRMYDDLKEEYGDDDECPKTPQELFSGGTHSEQEFGSVLYKLWEDRWSLTNDQKARIEAITKESFL
jgi:hypothetical protein